MASRSRNVSEKSNRSISLAGTADMEYFWSIELNADKRSVTWMVNSDDLEEDDEDFIDHTVFMKTAVLGGDAVPKEQNVVMFESMGGEGKVMKGAIANLCRGENNMTQLDMTICGKVGGTFTLTEGSGPVFISGNHLLEYPKEEDYLDNSQIESELSAEENGMDEDDEGDEDEEELDKAAIKRKATAKGSNKIKKPKMDVDEDDDDDDEEEDEDEEDDDEEDDDYEEEEKKPKRGKKGKPSPDVGKKIKAKMVKENGKRAKKIKK